jgi:hypothetical protein
MRHIFVPFVFLFFSFSQISCSGNEQAKNQQTASIENSTPAAATSGTGFSCIIDGKEVHGSAIDELQLQNTAFIYPDEGKGKRLLFLLFSSDFSLQAGAGCTFKMRCPDQEGTYVRAGLDDRQHKFSVDLAFTGGIRPDYLDDSVIFVVSSITPTRLKGTFSGRLTDASLQHHVQITNGKFDIPFSTGNLKPE